MFIIKPGNIGNKISSEFYREYYGNNNKQYNNITITNNNNYN